MKITFQVFLVCTILLFNAPARAAFDIQFVDDPGAFFGQYLNSSPEHAVAVAPDGTVYVAYGGDNLYLASRPSGGSWTIETVDTEGITGQYPSIALDSLNRPHISYHEGYWYDLKYARWTGTSWLVETVDDTGSTGQYTAIAVDSNDRPHISYHDFGNKNLMYAHWNGSSWNTETVDTAPNVGQYSSIAVDTSNKPHISYYDWGNSWLRYAHFNGTSWQVEGADISGSAGLYSSIALNSSDRPYISYAASSQVRYANRDNGITWQSEIVDTFNPAYISLAMDSTDTPHISYFVQGDADLKHARWNGSAWEIETVDSAGDVGRFSSIFLDSADVPHISCLLYTSPSPRDRTRSRMPSSA